VDLFQAVAERRSIRRFTDEPVSREAVERILQTAVLAPSAKNLQPWIFYILEEDGKEALVDVLQGEIENLEGAGMEVGSTWGSIRAMREAPVLVVVFNSAWARTDDRSGLNRYQYSVDLQSVGGAIEHMLLAARAQDLGSLWIGDVLYAEEAICSYFDTDRELVAAVAIGHPAEDPAGRPRRSLREVALWWDQPS